MKIFYLSCNDNFFFFLCETCIHQFSLLKAENSLLNKIDVFMLYAFYSCLFRRRIDQWIFLEESRVICRILSSLITSLREKIPFDSSKCQFWYVVTNDRIFVYFWSFNVILFELRRSRMCEISPRILNNLIFSIVYIFQMNNIFET